MRSVWVKACVFACVFVLAVAASGCKSVAEKAAEKAVEGATGDKVDLEGDKVTITGEGGSITAGGDQELPEDFPSDVPVYKGARITGSITGEQNGVKTFTITYLSNDEPSAVYDWYMSEVKAQGWKVLMSAAPDQGGLISAEKGSYLINAGIGSTSEDGAKTSVVLAVGPPVNK